MATINLDGKDRELFATCDAIDEAAKYPEVFGEGEFDYIKFLAEFEKNKHKPEWIAKMLWLLLYHKSRELTPMMVIEMVHETDASIFEILHSIMTVIMHGAIPLIGGEKKTETRKPKSKLPGGN